eukprot:2565144-Rhodomonas_salina.4
MQPFRVRNATEMQPQNTREGSEFIHSIFQFRTLRLPGPGPGKQTIFKCFPGTRVPGPPGVSNVRPYTRLQLCARTSSDSEAQPSQGPAQAGINA